MIIITDEELKEVQNYFNKLDKKIVKMFGYWFKDIGDQFEVFTDDGEQFIVIDRQ